MFDIIIRDTLVYDGTGGPGVRASVAIENGRIAEVGDVTGDAERIIDGSGLVTTPGFIDIHSHTDAALLIDPRAESKLGQGITLEVCGNCGFSMAPCMDEAGKIELESWRTRHEVEADWETMDDALSSLEEHPIGLNFATLVGHSNLRAAAVGLKDRAATPAELARMKSLAAEAMEQGAFGLSSGLIYSPSCFAHTDELVAVSEAVRPYGGFYSSHIRNERDSIIEAVAEAIEVGRRAGVPVQISHHKACGSNNWGKVRTTVQMIEQAREEGVDVTVDQYPYTAGATTLSIVLPSSAHDGGDDALLWRVRNEREDLLAYLRSAQQPGGWIANDGGWKSVMISSVGSDRNRSCEGKTILEISQERSAAPEDVVLDLLSDEELAVGMVHFAQCEDDIHTVMRTQFAMIGTDASARCTTGELSGGKPHPRTYGCFPRVLAKYVREQKVISLQEAVRKMTSMPARKLGLRDRGTLEPGYQADVVVFDPERIADTATYANPHQLPVGIAYVLVNGQIALEDGKLTGVLAGRVLRRR